jgi:hypothetical protein
MPKASYYERNRDSILARRKARYATDDAHRQECISRQRAYRTTRPENMLLSDARRRAKASDLPFDLTVDDIVIPETCPVLGIPLVIGNSYSDRESSPSIDKLVPERGYVRGNVCVISFRANRLKSDATLTELEAVTNYVRKYTNNYGPQTQSSTQEA